MKKFIIQLLLNVFLLSGCATMKPKFPLNLVDAETVKFFDKFEKEIKTYPELVKRKSNDASIYVQSRTQRYRLHTHHRRVIRYKLDKNIFPYKTAVGSMDMYKKLMYSTVDKRYDYSKTPFITNEHTKKYHDEFVKRYNPAVRISYEDFFIKGRERFWYIRNYLYLMQDGVTIINLAFFNDGPNQAVVNILHTLSTNNRITLKQIKGLGVKSVHSMQEKNRIAAAVRKLGKDIQKDSYATGDFWNRTTKRMSGKGQGTNQVYKSIWMDNSNANFSVTNNKENAETRYKKSSSGNRASTRSSTRVPISRNKPKSTSYSRSSSPSGNIVSTIKVSGDNVSPIPKCDGLTSPARKKYCLVERSFSESSACKMAKEVRLNIVSVKNTCGINNYVDSWEAGACNCGGKEGAVVGCRVVYSYSCAKTKSKTKSNSSKTQ